MSKNGVANCSSCVYVWPNLFLLAFVVLKLVGVIDWSWWWVFSPLFLEIGVIVGAIVATIAILAYDNHLTKTDASYRLRKFFNAYEKKLGGKG